jgi:aminopeptidase N
MDLMREGKRHQNRESIPVFFACFVYFAFFVFSPGLPKTANSEMNNDSLATEGVSRGLALKRAAVISDLRYRLSLEIEPGVSRLKGREEIKFKLANTRDQVVLDFRDLDQNGKVNEGAIGDIAVNGQPVNDLQQINGHVILPARHFKSGDNIISLKFETGVAPAGRPIIRYLDQDDGSEYIYTLFVPMDASLAFPCFDQPDLKARFKLGITAPSTWQVIGNENIERIEPAETANHRRTHFLETPPISTYLFAFAAGPFKQIAGAGASVPLRLFVRQSKLQRAKEEWPEVLNITRWGMSHFIRFFDHRFPFAKYDQVLIPGFAYGGMEHAGATFLREDSILFRVTPTRSDKLGRASLVLHELAHQWFGDLVTMRWFDDLWLKEGFANFMAYHAMAAIYDQNETWKRFYQAHKPLAYNIDATKGTTPIYQEVQNLKDAKSAYGAIVYQKAPSLLRALSFVVGEEKFREGVGAFLKEHAYANAEWNDLIRAFERSSKQQLDLWAGAWVKRRGMPQVDIDWSCDAKGSIERFELKQRDVLNEGGLWPIKTQLLLAYDEKQPVRIVARLETGQATVSEAIGKKCPIYVFANEGDFGYGRFLLDERSRRAVTERIGGITDNFHRTMLWGAVWDAVRETEMSPSEYIVLALNSLPGEKDEELTQSMLDRVTRAYQRYLSKTEQTSLAPKIETLCFEQMMQAGETGLRITYFRAFRAIATTGEARQRLKDILKGKLTAPGVEIKQLDRWRIIAALLAQQDADAESLLEAERKLDKSDDGRKQAYIVEVARAESSTKQRYFDDYLKNRAIPEDWVEGSLQPFNSLNQSELTLPYLKQALEALPQVKRERKIFFVLAWLNAFIGGQQSQGALDQVREFLRVNRIDRDLELKVLEVMDELERTVRIRTKFSRV